MGNGLEGIEKLNPSLFILSQTLTVQSVPDKDGNVLVSCQVILLLSENASKTASHP